MVYVPATIPRNHQVEAAKRTRGKRVFAYLCEMGTGKSKMLIDEFGEREEVGTLHDLLIVAPAGAYRNWDLDRGKNFPSEFKKHMPKELYNRTAIAAWVSSPNKRERAFLDYVLQARDRPRCLVVNIEALSSVEEARIVVRSFLSVEGRRSMLAVDESVIIKNPTAFRTKFMLSVKELANLRRIMTGLVAPRSPLDLYTQFEFLDWRILGFKSWFAFRARYCILETMRVSAGERKVKVAEKATESDEADEEEVSDLVDLIMGDKRLAEKQAKLNEAIAVEEAKEEPRFREIKVVVGYRNVEELNKKIAPYSYRVLKEDCLDLPPKIYQRRDIPLTPEQEKAYREMLHFCVADLGKEQYVTATMVMNKMLRLHQIAVGHTTTDDGDEVDIKSNRVSELMSLLEDHSGKAVIWTNYVREAAKIAEALREAYGPLSTAIFSGANAKTRSQDQELFLSVEDCRWMIATKAGARGNTWVNANLCVFFSWDNDLDMRLQAEDRLHRDGLLHSVTYVDFIAPGRIEEKIIRALREKYNIASKISGDNYREWLI